VILKRIAYTEYGVFGVLVHNGIPFTLTVERPWLDNKQDVSCIPEGLYTCVRHHSERHPDTFRVQNVPGRTGILFHTGNHMDHSAGCIIVGEKFDPYKDEPGIQSSTEGFGEFMDIHGDRQTFELLITNNGK
jgi:hypothetical protein